ncbi:MAG: 5-formyltetrahydrofolate cyclo-ligase [Bacteroides sp.]|nr:5-formyltetrahydrofolate cyclo-ligase [Bacteroides sp.]
MQIKSELRKLLLEERKRFSETLSLEFSRRINENLFRLEELKRAETVLCYVSKKNEISTEAIIARCLSEGKKIAAPVCQGSEMIFKYIRGFDDLEKGGFSVYEPKEYCEEARIGGEAVCVTPALCFNGDGYRIGYGKGFYDRFFEKNKCKRVGLCREDLIRDFIPDEHDMAVDIIVTEERIIRIR